MILHFRYTNVRSFGGRGSEIKTTLAPSVANMEYSSCPHTDGITVKNRSWFWILTIFSSVDSNVCAVSVGEGRRVNSPPHAHTNYTLPSLSYKAPNQVSAWSGRWSPVYNQEVEVRWRHSQTLLSSSRQWPSPREWRTTHLMTSGLGYTCSAAATLAALAQCSPLQR